MVHYKTPPIDIKQFVLKTTDIGYDTEVATEMTPTGKQAYGKVPQQQASGNTRPPLMLYPGE